MFLLSPDLARTKHRASIFTVIVVVFMVTLSGGANDCISYVLGSLGPHPVPPSPSPSSLSSTPALFFLSFPPFSHPDSSSPKPHLESEGPLRADAKQNADHVHGPSYSREETQPTSLPLLTPVSLPSNREVSPKGSQTFFLSVGLCICTLTASLHFTHPTPIGVAVSVSYLVDGQQLCLPALRWEK